MAAESAETIKWWLVLFLPALFLTSVVLLFLSFRYTGPTSQAAPLNPQYYLPETARAEILNQKSIVGNCHLCHAYWVAIPRSIKTSSPRFAHGDIILDHGGNDRCYNCHHIADRNTYTANDGSTLMTELPEELCRRCHGLIYQDWQHGTHGKWIGQWAPFNKWDRTNITCNQCHDPHAPKFRYKTIAPAPMWPEKFIRTEAQATSHDPTLHFQIETEPKEIF